MSYINYISKTVNCTCVILNLGKTINSAKIPTCIKIKISCAVEDIYIYIHYHDETSSNDS